MKSYRDMFDGIYESVLVKFGRDEHIVTLNIDGEHDVTAGAFGSTYVLVDGADSGQWGPDAARATTKKYDLITICETFPANDTKHDFLAACEDVLQDHGKVVVWFNAYQFSKAFDMRTFAHLVKGCDFVIERFDPQWGGAELVFTLAKDFGQGHCGTVSSAITA